MKVILNVDVKHLGEEGDVKNVATGYARNYLLPRNLVVPFNETTAAMFEARKAEIEARKEIKRQNARTLKEKLEGASFEVVMPAGANGKLYGAVTTAVIADVLAKQGFEIERKLKERCDIPVFHDDQHGTAICCAAAMINACRLTGRKLYEIKMVVNGAGAAAIAVTKLLVSMGLKNVIMCDKFGALYEGCEQMNAEQAYMATITNPENKRGTLADVLPGADIFFGMSAPHVLTKDMVRTMAKDPMVFPMANPTPEIMPEDALEAGAAVVGCGRSDYPNQINNVLAFPGVFRGALDVRASDINEEMKIAAAYAIANVVSDEELNAQYIMPKAFDPRVRDAVAAAVAQAARDSGVARI